MKRTNLFLNIIFFGSITCLTLVILLWIGLLSDIINSPQTREVLGAQAIKEIPSKYIKLIDFKIKTEWLNQESINPNTTTTNIEIGKINFQSSTEVKLDTYAKASNEANNISPIGKAQDLEDSIQIYTSLDPITINKELKNNIQIQLGLDTSIDEAISGCDGIEWHKLSNNNILPINYYLTSFGSKTYLIKIKAQINKKTNIDLLDVKNYCLK